MQQINYKNVIEKNVIWFYFAISCLGLIKLTNIVAVISYAHLDFSSILMPIYAWMGGANDPGKFPILLTYVYSLIAVFLFSGTCFLIHFYGTEPAFFKFLFKHKQNMIYAGLAIFGLNVCFFFTHNDLLSVFLLIIWLALFASIVMTYCYACLLVNIKKLIIRRSPSNTTYVVIFAVICIQFVAMFYPMVFKTMLVANDYFDLPEKTVFKNHHVVDNTTFFNTHHIGGVIKYDPRTDHGKTPFDSTASSVMLPDDPMLEYFLYLQDPKTEHKYFYDRNTHLLTLKGGMTREEHRELVKIYHKINWAKKAVDQLFVLSLKQANFYKTRIYTPEENEFIQHNLMEMIQQSRAGWFFFHHSWVLAPIHAASLGASLRDQPLIYGLTSTLMIQKAMEYLGGISYKNYFHVLFSFYPLYYLLFLGVIFLVFQRVDYLCLAALCLSSVIFGLQDESIRLAPGYNPIRHFFDMPAFIFFYCYLKKIKTNHLVDLNHHITKYSLQNNGIGYLIGSLLTCLFSILWSKDFGICLLFAISATTLIDIIVNKGSQTQYIGWLILFALICGVGLYGLPLGKNPNLIYVLLGYGTPLTPRRYLFTTLFTISLLSLCYARFIRSKEPMVFLSLSIFFYVQIGLIYFIWNPSHHHLLILTIPGIFLGLTWLSLWEKRIKNHSSKIISWLVLSTGLCIYLPAMLYFYYERLQYNHIFSSHVTYNWTLKNAQFTSTMEPTLIEQSLALINRYEHHKKMYLISKYDSFLVILSDKYNAIPTVNIALDLVSHRDTNRFFDVIEHDAPHYIFMDTDLARNFNSDIYDVNNPLTSKFLYLASYGRASMLTNIFELYTKIITSYVPIREEGLLTVYEKRN